MVAAPPPRDSALDALGFAFGVLRKPGYLWAPMVFALLYLLPLLAVPGFGGTPPGLGSSSVFGEPPAAFATQAELDAYLNSLIPASIVFTVFALVIGPIAGAVIYRLGLQYVEGEPPRPFAPGILNLAWRYFLQTLAFVLLVVLGILAVALIAAITFAVLGDGAGFLVAAILGVVLVVVVGLRLGLAPILLLWGAGPIEAIDRCWALTRGHLTRVLRWFVVIGVLVGLLSAAVSGAVSAVFAAAGLGFVGQVVGAVVVAPFGVMQAIGFVQLVRLLQNPIPPPLPPALPEWMNPPGARDAADPPAAGSGPAPTA